MASENVNTVQITAYTPQGFRVYVNVALVTANELDTLLSENGYLPRPEGANVGETIETMTHVSRRTHVKDGQSTPVLAFYHENTGMVWKQDHVYFNTPEQIAEFENVSGMALLSIPEIEGTSFLSRNDANSQNCIVPLTNHVRVALARKPYKKQDGTQGETDKIQRFMDAGILQTPQEKGNWNEQLLAKVVNLFSTPDAAKLALTHARNNGKISSKNMNPDEAALIITNTINTLDDIPF